MPLHAVARPAKTDTTSPKLLVLLHGLAADEYDLMGLADEVDPEWFIVSYRAPHLTGYGGYSWFGIEFLPDGSRLIDEVQAVVSRDLLIDEMRRLPEALGLTPSLVVLGGFSQGAMMASGVLLRETEGIDAVWLMSGRIVPAFASGGVTSHPKPVLSQHGVYDEVLPVEDGRALADLLRERGHIVSAHEYPMGHQISGESLADAREWLQGIQRR